MKIKTVDTVLPLHQVNYIVMMLIPVSFLFLAVMIPDVSYCQQDTNQPPNGSQLFTMPLESVSLLDAAATPDSIPERKLAFNEADFGFTTARVGMAFMNDWAWYSQDEPGKAQMDSAGVELKDVSQVRDVRFLLNGKINSSREIIWKIAVMYDGVERGWAFRETGLLIGLPELSGKVFLGRSKEGYSFNKVQNGFSTLGIERQPSLDLISIMQDGIRFFGDVKGPDLFWSIGAYTNLIYGQSKFMIYEWTYSGRVGWLPIYHKEENEVLHLGVNFRYAKPANGTITAKSRPESNPAPYFINTGAFETDQESSIGWEAYYFKGPLMLGSEGNVHNFSSAQVGDPQFFGANATISYNLTGESYPYVKDNAASFFIDPINSVFDKGWGAWQLLLTGSVFNTNDGLKPGGNFWKVTSVASWFLSYNFTMKFSYGYGVLDRFHLEGATHFFQTRLQFQLL
ncbi:MAG TPA: porin [Candidatus Kapabacteria bacterium]